MVLFRMARHFTEGSGVGPARSALTRRARCTGPGNCVGSCSGADTERLHAALAAYREMPKLPSPTEVVRAEANIVENTFDLPASKFRDGI